MNIVDRPTTDLTFRKISNGHVSAACHPIHFIYSMNGHYALPSGTIPHYWP